MAGIDFIHQNGVDYEIVPEIAPRFKTTVNYAAGDCVIYNAEAYRFKTAHLAGAWIGTDAEKFLVGEELGAIKEDLSGITEPINIGYVTEGLSAAHYGITYERVDRYTLKLYGTATQIANIIPLMGLDLYGTQTTMEHTIQSGTYTYVLEVSGYKSTNWGCVRVTEAGTADYSYQFDDNQTKGTFTVTDSAAIFFRFFNTDPWKDFGTAENPTYIKFALYKGESDITEVIEKSATAKDDTARQMIAEINAELHPTISPYNKGEFNTYKADFADFYTGKNDAYDNGYNAETQTGFGSLTKYNHVIQKFDELMAMDTAHITKNALGTASGTDENENPYTIYEYVFSPNAYKSSLLVADASLKKNPVILCDASIHGFEKNSTYGLYYFLYDLVNNYHNDPVLSAIRDNVIIKVIPVVNPYGFDNDDYYNGNDVNINRNFNASDWSAGEHTGLAPFDQPESAIVRDWVLANQADLMAYFNMHTNGRYYVSSFRDANSLMPKFSRTNGDDFYNKIAFIMQRHIQMQSARFPEMYDFSLDSFFGKYQAETGSIGTAAVWAAEQAKVISMTFEMFNGIKINDDIIVELFSSNSKKMCSELIGNMIAQTVFEYSE